MSRCVMCMVCVYVYVTPCVCCVCHGRTHTPSAAVSVASHASNARFSCCPSAPKNHGSSHAAEATAAPRHGTVALCPFVTCTARGCCFPIPCLTNTTDTTGRSM